MQHLRRCSAVRILPSSRSTAPPPLGCHEVLRKIGASSPPSTEDVVVAVTRHSAPSNCVVVCRAVTRLVLSSLSSPTARELTGILDRSLVLPAKPEFSKPREPPDPPIPPDPPPWSLFPASYSTPKTQPPYLFAAPPEIRKSQAVTPMPHPRSLSPASYLAPKTLSPPLTVASPEIQKSRAATSDAHLLSPLVYWAQWALPRLDLLWWAGESTSKAYVEASSNRFP